MTIYKSTKLNELKTSMKDYDGKLKLIPVERSNVWLSFYLPLLVSTLILTAFLLVKFTTNWQEAFIVEPSSPLINRECHIQLVESIPEGLVYDANAPRFMSTFDAWSLLINSTHDELDIGSFYWSLRGVDIIPHPSAAQGEKIFNSLMNFPHYLRIAESIAMSHISDNADTEELAKHGGATVRELNMTRLLGSGVMHSKLWISDMNHFYVGSANSDWRSLTQVKELGVLGINCPTLALELGKIFEIYWLLGGNDTSIPDQYPPDLVTNINVENPLLVNYNNNKYQMYTYVSSSPPPLSSVGRTQDLDAILNTINSAQEFINIAVMDYYPLEMYKHPVKYWPYIDDALRTAAVERGVSIKLLISWWKHSQPAEDYFLRSLASLTDVMPNVNIEIKRFIVPVDVDQARIPYARVNHNKYMVTDNTAYIGTSNWSGDYFTDTAGIGLVLRDMATNAKTTLRNDLLSVFVRDWDSVYAFPLASSVN